MEEKEEKNSSTNQVANAGLLFVEFFGCYLAWTNKEQLTSISDAIDILLDLIGYFFLGVIVFVVLFFIVMWLDSLHIKSKLFSLFYYLFIPIGFLIILLIYLL
jgi:hypothetical protein